MPERRCEKKKKYAAIGPGPGFEEIEEVYTRRPTWVQADLKMVEGKFDEADALYARATDIINSISFTSCLQLRHSRVSAHELHTSSAAPPLPATACTGRHNLEESGDPSPSASTCAPRISLGLRARLELQRHNPRRLARFPGSTRPAACETASSRQRHLQTRHKLLPGGSSCRPPAATSSAMTPMSLRVGPPGPAAAADGVELPAA